MKLFDAHCHLPAVAKAMADTQDATLLPEIGGIMARAAEAGVERMACCGTLPSDWTQVLQLAEKFPQIIPMIGIHPWFVKGRDSSPSRPIQILEKMVRDFPNIGIGETGLDFSSFAEATADRQEKFTNRAGQEASFAAHLDLARELNRPVAVHCVHAWGRLIEILREHPAPKIILHAFGAAPELVPELVEMNCWFSFCGSVTNPNAKRARASVVVVPEDRLLIETDSPDFPLPGCEAPNEPANLIHVARAVAELRGVSVEAVASRTFSNATQVFSAV